ncbi:hypothetical protein FDZ84_09330 [Saccharopolyspora sp. ASAGF58]|nr:hypothetical protein FDZ84_09330 [Saccharopolyspora sp. ASAGF58]
MSCSSTVDLQHGHPGLDARSGDERRDDSDHLADIGADATTARRPVRVERRPRGTPRRPPPGQVPSRPPAGGTRPPARPTPRTRPGHPL